MKDKTRKRIIALLIILTVAFAWIHSAMPVPVSQGESGHVLAFLRPILKLFLPEHMVTDHLVRKLAHFAEYAALGAELALYVLPDAGIRPKSIVRVLYAGATVALIDETIQIFSGRGPMISDVWLDVGGGATGALVICIILKIVSGKKINGKLLRKAGIKTMEKLKIAFFDAKDYDKDSFVRSNGNGEFDITYFEVRLSPDTYKLAEGYDVVCVFVNDDINRFVIDRLKEAGVKLIALRCAGYNNVDIEYAYEKIHVVRVPAYSPYAVAEHAMALLLTSIRRIHKAYIRTKDFNFSLNGLTGFDLHGKTVGVVGTGKIGRIFIDICRGFGMNVIAYDKFPAADSGIEYVTLGELWQKSDIISLHCPLTDESRHMIDEKSIEKMKKGVVIINTSRGALIDSEALVEGIKQRRIGAACLDVYEEESNVFFHDYSNHIVNDDTLARLISMPNVIVTSHQAFLTNEALSNIADTTLDNVREFFEKDTCSNEVCYKCSNLPNCKQTHEKKCF